MALKPRLDEKPWGGRRLGNLGVGLPDEGLFGEAVISAGDAVIEKGPFAGEPLEAVVRRDPEAVSGRHGLAATGGSAVFPLLVKLIDAAENLSVQVHPDDATAPEGRLGKTEAYHVLESAPGAAIALGLGAGVTEEEFAEACQAGSGATYGLLRWVPAVAGETIVIPAGTVHALGAGCMVYEVQQPSDITYRFDDGGRVDRVGRRRELHVEAGMAVMNRGSRPEVIAPVRIAGGAGRRQLLCACQFFALERIALAGGEEVSVTAAGSAQVLTCLRGEVEIGSEAGQVRVSAGVSAILAAVIRRGMVRARTPAVVLRAWVPDLVHEAIGPAREGGAADASIWALSGALEDLREAMRSGGG